MPRKSRSAFPTDMAVRLLGAFLALHTLTAQCADESSEDLRRFLGANSCASSGCHGGAGAHQNQYLVWSSRDFHFQRPVATLTTARSRQISETLQIKDATGDHRCISCHAPLREVPEKLRGESLRVSEGVSCETCHGPGESWLRSHTRPDYTHADRVGAGMRDLKNLYVRANTCVACHQNVSLPLLEAGHPELIFELDGQAVTEPKHWRENENWHGAQAWAVGQSVALREMLWQLETTEKKDEHLLARAAAVAWLFEKLDAATNGLPKSGLSGNLLDRTKFREARAAADILARDLSALNWTAAQTDAVLKTLAAASGDFKKGPAFPEQHARRAERLVLAFDRLVDSRQHPEADAQLKKLFALAQSIPDFDASAFAAGLDSFARALHGDFKRTATK